MLFNTCSVLALVALVFRLIVSGSVVFACFRRDPSRVSDNAADGDARLRAAEKRESWLLIATFVAAVLMVVSWPLFYATLQSMVTQWKDVMCLYGVMMVGSQSSGSTALLPFLLGATQWLKPIIIFAAGAWLVAVFIRPSPVLMKSAALLSLAIMIEAGIEAAYLLIPKTSQELSVGCCVVRLPEQQSLPLWGWLPFQAGNSEVRLGIAGKVFLTLHAVLGGLLLILARQFRPKMGLGIAAVVVAVLALPLAIVFLNDVLAPAILSVPFHRCAFDLMAHLPEVNLGIALYMMATFAVGWGFVAVLRSQSSDDQHAGPSLASRLFLLALFGHLGSTVLFSVEAWLS